MNDIGNPPRSAGSRGLTIRSLGTGLRIGLLLMATTTFSLAESGGDLGGKNDRLECDGPQCTYDKEVGATHSKDWYVKCSTGDAPTTASYCKTTAPKHVSCSYSIEGSIEFHCHCKNKSAMQDGPVYMEVDC